MGVAKENTPLRSRIKLVMRFEIDGKAKATNNAKMLISRRLAIQSFKGAFPL